MRIVELLFFGLIAFPAHANTVTFNGIPFWVGGQTQYIENGISVAASGREIASWGIDNAAHMDDSGTVFPRQLNFTMSRQFDALSFDINPAGFENELYYFAEADNIPGKFFSNLPWDNVSVVGVSGGAIVASLSFNMLDYGNFGQFHTVSLHGFTGLDSLVIGFNSPSAANFPDILGFTKSFQCGAPCSHFDLDNVVLSPVPLPAGLPLMLAGLGVLGLVRRRKS